MYVQQNNQVQQNSQQHQQFWSQAGYSNTYPKYAEVNDSQSAQFNPGYGQQTTYQQLTTNPGYKPLQNNYVNGNSNQKTAYDDAQTRNFPRQWQVSACQMTTRQDSTFPGNWSNQRQPKMTEQTETYPYQNMQNSVGNHNLMPLKFNYLPENVKKTVPHNRGGHRESNTELTSTFRWKLPATHGKQVEATRKKEGARKNQTQTPYTASTRTASPRFTMPRKPMPPLDATFISSVQLPVSQTHMQLQSGAGAAPAFSNSPVFRPPPPHTSCLSRVKDVELPQATHLMNPNNPGRNPPPSYSCQKAVAVVQPLSQKNTQVPAKKSCPERMGRQKDTSIDGCVDNIQIDGNTLPHLFQPLPESDGSEKDGSGSDQKHPPNANIEPTNDGTVSPSLLPKGNVKESEAHQSVTLDSSHGKEIPKSGVEESETDDVGLLSVVPVRTWTHKQLTALVEITTGIEMIKPCHSNAVVDQLIKHLWDNDPKKALSLIKSNYYKELMTGVIDFCKDTHDSTILSHIDSKNWDRVKEKCTVLEDDGVHFESPYVSPWLNVNRQLDDIDNEFGFPSSLKNGESKCNTETNPMETKCVIPVDIVKEMAIENVPLIAPALDVVEAAKSILQTKCTLSIVPDEALTVDLNDPLDLLEIETMHPDQARIVFEQLKNGSSLIEFKSNEFSTTEERTSMEEFCCINRWIEKILGKEPSFECSCKSLSETNKPCVISTGDLEPSEKENIIEVSLNPMRSNSKKGSKTVDLTKQFEVPQKGYDNTPITPPSTMDFNEEDEIINILRSIKGSISTTALEDNFNKELKPVRTGETLNIDPKQAEDHDEDHTAVCAKHPIAESSEDHTSTPKAILTIAQKQSNSDKHDLKSIGSHLTAGPNRLSPTVDQKDACPQSLKMRLGLSRKRRRTIGKILPFEEPVTSVYQPAIKDTSNDLIKEKVVADDSTTAAEKTVKLALFGSTEHRSGVSGPRGKSHSSSQWYSGLPHPPPSVVTLTICSVRDRICEEWRNSYLPITIKNGKSRTIRLMDIHQNSNSATNAPVEAELIDMERLPASPEQTFPLGSGKKRGRRKAHAEVLPLETTQMPNNSVTKKWLVNSRSISKTLKVPDMRRKENRGLRLGLLRHHLEIKAGPRRRKDKRASALDASKSAAMTNGLKTTIQRSIAGWARIPDKKHGLLTSSNVALQCKSTFQESQKTNAKRKSLEYCD
ncbi:unnamed protein product [Gadus morhua 'NCC']